MKEAGHIFVEGFLFIVLSNSRYRSPHYQHAGCYRSLHYLQMPSNVNGADLHYLLLVVEFPNWLPRLLLSATH